MQEARPRAVGTGRARQDLLAERVAHFFRRYSTRLLQCGTKRGGVAVSGGADSSALMHLLAEWARSNEWELAVLHFHHGLRGAEADEDLEFVKGQAEALGLAFHWARWEQAPASNVEAAARRARLDFFKQKRCELGLGWVATGHTLDDQAETVLLRLLRGAGTRGLAGILPVTREGLVRPLLEFRREALREWLTEQRRAWREDKSNANANFADRNRLRLELMPRLVEAWNPQIVRALAQTAEIVRDEEIYWKREADKYVPPDLVFQTRLFCGLEIAMQRRVIRGAVERCTGSAVPLDFRSTERVRGLFLRPTGHSQVMLPGGVVAERSFGEVRIAKIDEAAEPQSERVTWAEIAEVPACGALGQAYNEGRSFLDKGRVSGGLELDCWAPGDRFQPMGAKEPWKVKDLFQFLRIPSWKRRSWPMLRSGATVVWMRGLGPAAEWEAKEADAVQVFDPGWDLDVARRADAKWKLAESKPKMVSSI